MYAVEMEGVLSAGMIAGAELRDPATRPNQMHADTHRPRRQEEQGSTAESEGPVHDSRTLRCAR